MERKRKPKNLTIDPEVMQKFEHIAKELDMSVSALTEQLMRVVIIVSPVINNLPPEKRQEIDDLAKQRPDLGKLAAILHVLGYNVLGIGHAIEKDVLTSGKTRTKAKDALKTTSGE